MDIFKTILVAVDFSDSSNNAFRLALSMAKQCSAHLVILHVINEPIDLRGFYVPHISYEKLEEEIAEGAEKMMESFCRQQITDYTDFESMILPGLPHEQILAQAEKSSAELIILGTHGRTGLDHVLFGSTAEKVVRKSRFPVLTVRLDESE